MTLRVRLPIRSDDAYYLSHGAPGGRYSYFHHRKILSICLSSAPLVASAQAFTKKFCRQLFKKDIHMKNLLMSLRRLVALVGMFCLANAVWADVTSNQGVYLKTAKGFTQLAALENMNGLEYDFSRHLLKLPEIGRASCRERVSRPAAAER